VCGGAGCGFSGCAIGWNRIGRPWLIRAQCDWVGCALACALGALRCAEQGSSLKRDTWKETPYRHWSRSFGGCAELGTLELRAGCNSGVECARLICIGRRGVDAPGGGRIADRGIGGVYPFRVRGIRAGAVCGT